MPKPYGGVDVRIDNMLGPHSPTKLPLVKIPKPVMPVEPFGIAPDEVKALLIDPIVIDDPNPVRVAPGTPALLCPCFRLVVSVDVSKSVFPLTVYALFLPPSRQKRNGSLALLTAARVGALDIVKYLVKQEKLPVDRVVQLVRACVCARRARVFVCMRVRGLCLFVCLCSVPCMWC